MKTKTLITILIILFVYLSTMAQVPTQGLVAYYPFSGNGNDASGNGYDASVVGATLCTDRFGNQNRAYLLDGNNDYIHLPSPNVGQLDGKATWACWFKTPPLPDNDGEYEQIFDIFHAGGTHIDSGYVVGGMEIGVGDRRFVYDNTQSYNNDQWHLIVLSYDDQYLRLYMDGQLKDSEFDGNGQIDYNGTLGIYLGKGGFNVHYYDGMFDDFRIYDRALTNDEVLALYNESNPGQTNFTVTFNVDMTEAYDFNPETDDVYIAGNFADWQEPGTNPDLVFSPSATGSLIYTLTFDSIPTGAIEYKYFIVHDNIPSWEYGEWGGDPNRFVYISDNITFDDIWAVIVPPEIEMIADFENGSSLDIDEVIGCGNWNNLPISETFFTVINPKPTGINTSNTVLKFLRRGTDEGGTTAAGFIAWHNLNVDDYDFLHIMVMKPKISPLKIISHFWSGLFYEAYNLNQQNEIDSWVDIVFDLRSFEEELLQFDFMPDYEDPLNSTGLVEIYIDNIRLSNDSVPMFGIASNFFADATDICEASNITFVPDTTNAYVDSVLWLFPGGSPSSSTETIAVVQYNTPGIYDVTMTAYWNSQTNTIQKSAYVNVAPNPEIPEKPFGEEMVCFDISPSAYTTNSENVIWELEPASAGTMNYYDSTCAIIWNDNFAGEAMLKAKSFNICGESEFSEALVIEKLEAILPDFSATPVLLVAQPYDVAFANLTPNPELYDFVWYFGNGDSSQIINPDYTYPESGTYTISLKATEKTTGCKGTIILENYIFCSGTGIGDIEDTGFKYFVDRNKNSLELIFDNTPDNLHFSLFDMLGFEHRTKSLVQKSTSISLDGFASGMYVFVINGKITGKVILLR